MHDTQSSKNDHCCCCCCRCVCAWLQVKEPRVLYGGGWPEMRMARAIEEAAKKTPGARVQFCGFDAILRWPRTSTPREVWGGGCG